MIPTARPPAHNRGCGDRQTRGAPQPKPRAWPGRTRTRASASNVTPKSEQPRCREHGETNRPATKPARRQARTRSLATRRGPRFARTLATLQPGSRGSRVPRRRHRRPFLPSLAQLPHQRSGDRARQAKALHATAKYVARISICQARSFSAIGKPVPTAAGLGGCANGGLVPAPSQPDQVSTARLPVRPSAPGISQPIAEPPTGSQKGQQRVRRPVRSTGRLRATRRLPGSPTPTPHRSTQLDRDQGVDQAGDRNEDETDRRLDRASARSPEPCGRQAPVKEAQRRPAPTGAPPKA